MIAKRQQRGRVAPASPMAIDVVIPALNEARALPLVLAEIPQEVRRVVVADNGSTDGTAEVARGAGAWVVHESRRGYGAACLAGLSRIAVDPPDVVVFLDGDHSDHPTELFQVAGPILAGEKDFVVGSRTLGALTAGALTPQQRVGNWIACRALRRAGGYPWTDLGPFRAIRWTSLQALQMSDLDYGWTVEMQIKAQRHGLRCGEVPVSYRARIGHSKVSGTIRGTLGASVKILTWLGRHA